MKYLLQSRWHDVFACTLLHRELRDYSLGQIAFGVFQVLFGEGIKPGFYTMQLLHQKNMRRTIEFIFKKFYKAFLNTYIATVS